MVGGACQLDFDSFCVLKFLCKFMSKIKIILYLKVIVFVVVASCESNSADIASVENELIMLPSDQPPEITFENIMEMLDEVKVLPPDDIEQMNKDQFIELSRPLLVLWKDTIILSNTISSELEQPLQQMALLSDEGDLTESAHKHLAERIAEVFSSNRYRFRRNLDQYIEEARNILENWSRNQKKTEVCSSLFNVSGSAIVLMPGDNFGLANHLCPEGTFYFIAPGTFNEQSVFSPKMGNKWIGSGAENTIINGQNRTDAAFAGRMVNNVYSFFQISDYALFAIHSIDRRGNKNVEISNMIFRNIGAEANGEEYGAIKTEWMNNITVEESLFENVTSSIRLVNSTGPLQVMSNKALNTGRNFFQCDKCSGGGIRINLNILEHNEPYGTDLLEDYINIFKSEGLPGDPIQVNDNRVRGHAGSLSGSFLILGDSGGKYQKAVGNIGVNPGQVGIGIAGGEQITVQSNIMFSDPWEGSNVAFYSAGFTEPCDQHEFPGPHSSNPNKSNWLLAGGSSNISWTDGKCGINNTALRDSIIYDPSIDSGIWNEL